MSLFEVEDIYTHNSASIEEDFLIKRILLTHDPDGSQLDSHLLVRTVENIILHATPVLVVSDRERYATSICNAEANGLQESLLFEISNEILCRCYEDGDIHANTMFLFEMLGKFRWDEKLVLVLAAFIMNYGEFQLIVQLQSHNPLAALVAVLRKVPCNLTLFRKQFKALMMLVKTMLELTKLIVEFENLPFQQELLEFKTIAVAKSKMYMAIYWILRSSYACFSVITGLRSRQSDQVLVLPLYPIVLFLDLSPRGRDMTIGMTRQLLDTILTLTIENPNSTTIVTWRLSSLFYRLNSLRYGLMEQVDACHQQIATRLYEKLLHLFNLTRIDNQEMLRMLIPLKDDFPFKDSLSNEKHSISELKNKVVIFLVSKPELLPIEKIFLLVQQTYGHPHHEKMKGSYVILWFPISTSNTWTKTDEMNFHILSNSLPFWSLRQPWLLNSAVINFFKQEWNFNKEIMMSVLDTHGMLSNSNAMDMIWIWGPKAFPFSMTREKELWETQDWTLQLILDNIDSLLSSWIDQAKNICIYASDNLEWIRNFCAKMKGVKESGLQLEVIYVGWQNPSEKLRSILDVIQQENLSSSLTFAKVCFFWFRLQSMRNSIIRHKHEARCDHIFKEVIGMLEVENANEGWMMIGTGASAGLQRLQGSKLAEFFDLFPVWAENVGTLGLVDAISYAFQPPLSVKHCNHLDIIPYEEGLIKDTVICKECRRPREKFVMYTCEESESKDIDSLISLAPTG